MAALGNGERCLYIDDAALAWRRLADEIMVLDVTRSKYYVIKGSGTILWERAALQSEPSTFDAMVTALVDEYGISEEQARGDVDVFLAELDALGLLAAPRA